LIPWEVSKSSVRCCCSSLIDNLGSQQLNVLSIEAPLLKLEKITTAAQLLEPTPEKPFVPVSAALQAALQESKVTEFSNVKLVNDHVQVPTTDIPKVMCLTLDDEPTDSTKAEKELFKNGFTVLDHQFHFNENHVQEFISVFDKAQLKIRPIRNTLEDLDAGDDWNIPGKDGPRSMMYETDMPKHMELEVIQQVKNALRDEPSLQWLTKNRPISAYTLIRSKPGTPHQFWHRDYCLKHKKNKRISAKKVPLFIIVAIQRQTSLDFPTGKIYIPLGRMCVVRGDMIHRGVGNPLEQVFHFRLHIVIEERKTAKYRVDDVGEVEFEPANEEESKEYDEAYESEMMRRLQSQSDTLVEWKDSDNECVCVV
jgi:hypothetical protein